MIHYLARHPGTTSAQPDRTSAAGPRTAVALASEAEPLVAGKEASMRRRTGAAGIAVAIAAIVPLADPAHAQEPDSWTHIHRKAAPSVSDDDPGDAAAFAPDPYAPDALSPDALGDGWSGEGPADGAGAGTGRQDEGGLEEYDPDENGLDEHRPDQGGNGQAGDGQDGNGQGGNGQNGFGQGGLDEGRPADGGPAQLRPEEGRLDQGRLDQGGRIDQVGFDAAREAVGGAADGAPPRRDSSPTISATSKPRPTPTTAVPGPTTSPTVTPTLGTQGGLGGASGIGPSGRDVGIGLTCVASAAIAAAYVFRRRRRA